MGGDVIVEAALHLPGRVRGLVWIDTYHTLGEPPTDEQVEEFLAPFREDFVTTTRDLVRRFSGVHAPAELVERVAADMSAAPPEIAIDAARYSYGNQGAVLARLPELTAPVVAINPDYRPTDVESLRRHGVEAVLTPGVGHLLFLEDPETFNQLLSESIQRFEK
jgi:pimeloyl-ACP methyl ester carboxylesterase